MTTALLAPTEHSLLSTPPLCPVSIPAAVRAGTSDSTVSPLCQERTYPEILRSQQCRLVIVLARPQRLHRGWQRPAARIPNNTSDRERLRSGFPADARALLRSQSGAYASGCARNAHRPAPTLVPPPSLGSCSVWRRRQDGIRRGRPRGAWLLHTIAPGIPADDWRRFHLSCMAPPGAAKRCDAR